MVLKKYHETKVTDWCGILLFEVIGPYYFDKLNVDGDSFLHLLNNYFLPMPWESTQNKIFQQVKAPTHYNCAVRHLLDGEMPNS